MKEEVTKEVNDVLKIIAKLKYDGKNLTKMI